MNNNQATLQKLEQMKLHGMTRAFTSTMETGVRNQFTADELVSHLVDAEWDDRHNRKLSRLLKGARFRYRASFEEIDFTLNPAFSVIIICTYMQKPCKPLVYKQITAFWC